MAFPVTVRRFPRAALALMLCSASVIAHADSRAEAKRHFRAGMARIEAGDVPGGIAELERAYALRPHPAVQFNIARAAEGVGDRDRALTAWRRYLEDVPNDPVATERIRALEAQRLQPAAPAPPDPAPPAAPPPEPAGNALEGPALPIPIPSDADPQTLRAAARLARMLAASMMGDAGPPPELEGPPAPTLDAGAPAGRVDPPDAGTPTAADAGSTTQPAEVMQALVEAPAASRDDVDAIYAERTVTASRSEGDVLDAPAFVTVLTREELDQSGARTVPELLRRIPGVSVAQMTQSDWNVSIRGLNRRLSNKILVLVDGRTVYQDFLGGTAWEVIPVNLDDIERIEVVRGPGAALYGASAFGGVVNIITRRPEDTGVEGTAEIGVPRQSRVTGRAQGVVELPGWPARARQEGCKQPWTCWLMERVWKNPRVTGVAGGGMREAAREELSRSRPDSQRLGAWPDSAAQSGRGFAQVELNAGPDHQARVEGGVVRLRQDLNAIASLRNYILDGTFAWTQASYRLGPVSVRGFYNRLDVDAAPELTARVPDPLRTHVLTHDLNVEPLLTLPLRIPYVGSSETVAGATYRFKAVEWSYLGRGQLQHHLGAFIQETWKPLPWLMGTVSYRVDRHPLAPPVYADVPLVGRLGVPALPGLSHSGRAALVARVKQTSFRVGAGTAFRDPTFLESYVDFDLPLPVDAAVFRFTGSPRLLPERIASAEAGFSTRALDGVSVDGAVYVMAVDRLIGLATPTPDKTPGLDDSGRYVAATGGFSNSNRMLLGGGGELLARFSPLDGVDVDLGYAQHRLFAARAFQWEDLRSFSSVAAGYAREDAWRARLEDPPYRFISAVRVRAPMGLEAGADVSLTGPTTWHEERVDPRSSTGVVLEHYELDPYLNTTVRLAWRLLDGKAVLSAVGQNILAPTHREHPFGDRIGPRGLLTLQLRP